MFLPKCVVGGGGGGGGGGRGTPFFFFFWRGGTSVFFLSKNLFLFFLSRLPQAWRDIGIRFSVRTCDHPSVNPTVQDRNSETL